MYKFDVGDELLYFRFKTIFVVSVFLFFKKEKLYTFAQQNGILTKINCQ